MAPIAYIPGLLCTPAVFDDLRAAVGAEAAVLAPPALDDFDDLAEALLVEMPDDCVLAGLSMGAYLALDMARRAPTRVAGLVLMGASARADDPNVRARRAKASAWARKAGIDALADSLVPALLGPAARRDAGMADTVRAMARAVGVETFAKHQAALAGRPDNRAALAGLDCPVLAIAGSEDALTPPEVGREIAAGVPDGRFVEIPGAGHLAPLEAPRAVAEAVRPFLSSARVPA